MRVAGDDHADIAVTHDEGDLPGPVADVDRHRAGAGEEDPVQGGDAVRAVRHQHADSVMPLDAKADQRARDLRRARADLRKRQSLSVGERDRVDVRRLGGRAQQRVAERRRMRPGTHVGP